MDEKEKERAVGIAGISLIYPPISCHECSPITREGIPRPRDGGTLSGYCGRQAGR